MAGVNKLILIGHLGRDPDVRRTQAGKPVVSFSMATSESWRDKASGERKERTEWHDVVIFNEPLCEIASKHLKKGSKVYIAGAQRTREWQHKDGGKRRSTECVLDHFRGELVLLDGASGNRPPPAGDSDAYGTTRSRDDAPMASASPGPYGGAGFDEDIPF